MAVTQYGVNHTLARKIWANGLDAEALKLCWAEKFMGTGSDSLIQIKDDTSKEKGDRIRFGLRMQLAGGGTQGDSTLEGNEEALTTYSDDVLIDQLRHGVRSAGKMSEQRVPFTVREEARKGLADWWADRLDTWFFNQICGYTAQADTRFTGNQAVIAPTSTRRLFTEAGATADEDLDATGDEMTLLMIDKAVTLARTLSPAIRPIMVKGNPYYVCFLHPYQIYQLRTNTNTGQWLDIQKAAMTGGLVDQNPIFDGSEGVYNGTVLHTSSRVTQGVNSSSGAAITTVRRAAFCGAQAAVYASGRGNAPGKYSWVEKFFDYENELGVTAGQISGLKKTVFNSTDFATIVISSYATTP